MTWLDALDARAIWADEHTTLLEGDSLRVLRDIPDGTVDLILADPPYSSGGAFRGDRAQSTGTKYVSAGSSRQSIEDFSEAYRTLQVGRACVVFTDWRQLPTTTDALQAGGFVWRGVCVWDKVGGRPSAGISNGAVEYAVWGTKGTLDLGHDVYLPSILRHAITRESRDLHQTPKPIELLAKLATLAPPGGLVVDPFTGSGSTLIAARRVGRRGLGVEISPTHAATAATRLATEAAQLDIFGEAA